MTLVFDYSTEGHLFHAIPVIFHSEKSENTLYNRGLTDNVAIPFHPLFWKYLFMAVLYLLECWPSPIPVQLV